jgi:pSer/pThr/pTyr-binding forkhead associated (FHA) protein
MFDKSTEVKVGRSTDSVLRINDISVSRNHALIRMTEEGLFLTDNGSKFGSLIKIKERMPVVAEMNHLQL